MKIEVRREVLHQLARNALGTSREAQPVSTVQAMAALARRLASVTATPSSGPVELVVIE